MKSRRAIHPQGPVDCGIRHESLQRPHLAPGGRAACRKALAVVHVGVAVPKEAVSKPFRDIIENKVSTVNLHLMSQTNK